MAAACCIEPQPPLGCIPPPRALPRPFPRGMPQPLLPPQSPGHGGRLCQWDRHEIELGEVVGRYSLEPNDWVYFVVTIPTKQDIRILM